MYTLTVVIICWFLFSSGRAPEPEKVIDPDLLSEEERKAWIIRNQFG